MWSDHEKCGQYPLSPIQENAALGDFEQGTKFFYGCLLDLRLDVEMLLRHLGVSVTHKALDRLHVHALCLKLAHIGVPTGVRSEEADITHFFQSGFEVLAKAAGIHRTTRHSGAFPDVGLTLTAPQRNQIRSDLFGDRNVPNAIPAFRRLGVLNSAAFL